MQMPSTKRIACVVTGKETVYSGDFLKKKINEYGSEERLVSEHICRDVKSLLKKGYKVDDIRKVLNVDDDVPYPDPTIIEKIENQFGKKSILKEHPTFNEALATFTFNKSDPDVEHFINEYIIKS